MRVLSDHLFKGRYFRLLKYTVILLIFYLFIIALCGRITARAQTSIITSISPSSGPISGGQQVTVAGSDFNSHAGFSKIIQGSSAYQSCGISSSKVYCWGDNEFGQLGNNSTANSSVPVAVVTSGVLKGKTITAISRGAYFSLALASDGTVYSWGRNEYGALGNNSTANSSVPVAVDTTGVLKGKTITAISGGSYSSLALASDGTVYSWGYNSNGELGNNSTANSSVPVAVDATGVLKGKTITAISGGGNHSLALASDGTVYSWGYNYYGELGNNSTANSSVPVAVDTTGVLKGKTITAISSGNVHSLALASDGTIYSWGDDEFGQLGNNSTSNSSVPVAADTTGVLKGKTITAISSGNVHNSNQVTSEAALTANPADTTPLQETNTSKTPRRYDHDEQ